MKVKTLAWNLFIILCIVAGLKFTGVGDMLVDFIANPAESVPSVEIGK